jgi:hypothetical protein
MGRSLIPRLLDKAGATERSTLKLPPTTRTWTANTSGHRRCGHAALMSSWCSSLTLATGNASVDRRRSGVPASESLTLHCQHGALCSAHQPRGSGCRSLSAGPASAMHDSGDEDVRRSVHGERSGGASTAIQLRTPSCIIRDGGSVAPSRTAEIGGTRVARRAGETVASTVTIVPTASETITVRAWITVPLAGMPKPSASKYRACSEARRAQPVGDERVAASGAQRDHRRHDEKRSVGGGRGGSSCRL